MVMPCFSKISFHTEKNNKAFVKNDDELIESETEASNDAQARKKL